MLLPRSNNNRQSNHRLSTSSTKNNNGDGDDDDDDGEGGVPNNNGRCHHHHEHSTTIKKKQKSSSSSALSFSSSSNKVHNSIRHFGKKYFLLIALLLSIFSMLILIHNHDTTESATANANGIGTMGTTTTIETVLHDFRQHDTSSKQGNNKNTNANTNNRTATVIKDHKHGLRRAVTNNSQTVLNKLELDMKNNILDIIQEKSRKESKTDHQQKEQRNDKDERSSNSSVSNIVDGMTLQRNIDDDYKAYGKYKAVLNCDAYHNVGTRTRITQEEATKEMVYWKDIPSDAVLVSPFHKKRSKNTTKPIQQFLTFEPDDAGWNNIRMSMETVFALAFAMGRTLVLPPHFDIVNMDDEKHAHNNNKQQHEFGFGHFFDVYNTCQEHHGFDVISMTTFLQLSKDGKISSNHHDSLLPRHTHNRTNYDGTHVGSTEYTQLTEWMRSNSGTNLIDWYPDKCIAGFPKSSSQEDLHTLIHSTQLLPPNSTFPSPEEYLNQPIPVNSSPLERLQEMNAERDGTLCLYTKELQNIQWLHLPVGMNTSYPFDDSDEEDLDYETSRLLVSFYEFLFFYDWEDELWMKRFMRDHIKYNDELQCAAARIVTAIRRRTVARTRKGKQNGTRPSTSSSSSLSESEEGNGIFDTIHVRRTDFQQSFESTHIDNAQQIIEEAFEKIPIIQATANVTTLYIATDEKNKSFFEPITKYYADVVYLDDFIHTELQGMNTNYYGIIDQLVASKGRYFFGCWFSTYTAYINRLRGYHTNFHKNHSHSHSDSDTSSQYELGIIPSYYYTPKDKFNSMQQYHAIKKDFFAREYPTSWRLIDASIQQ